MAGQVGGEPPPQVGGVGVEQHGGGVVVAVAAQRAAEPRIVVTVAAGAGDVAAVRATTGVDVAAGSAGQDGFAAHPPGVDRAERGCGEGGEHARMVRDRFGDAFAAGQARADELAGVTLVDRRAGGADGVAAVPARGQQHSPRFGGAVIDGGEFAADQVDRVDAAPEPYRMLATAGRGELPFGGEEAGPGDRAVDVVGGRSQLRTLRAGAGGDRRGGAYQGCPQRCWAAWRVTPSRVPISAQE